MNVGLYLSITIIPCFPKKKYQLYIIKVQKWHHCTESSKETHDIVYTDCTRSPEYLAFAISGKETCQYVS